MIRFFSRRKSTASKASRRYCPQLEMLESRLTPAFTLSVIASFPVATNLGNGLENALSTNLAADSNGDLFGGLEIDSTTTHLATSATLFELVKGSSTLTTLATFNLAALDGVPNFVTVDANGN